jgi:hypothetical protein
MSCYNRRNRCVIYGINIVLLFCGIIIFKAKQRFRKVWFFTPFWAVFRVQGWLRNFFCWIQKNKVVLINNTTGTLFGRVRIKGKIWL